MSEHSHPLTVAQQEVWAGAVLDESGRKYLNGGYVHIRGRIDVAIFEQALRTVIAGSETLRVRIDATGPEPRQLVTELADWPLRRGDFSAEPDPMAAALAFIDHELTRPFDMAAAPLFDHHLLDLGAAGHLWSVRVHHVICDGASSLAMVRRVASVYTELLAGQPVSEAVFDTVAALLDADTKYRASHRYAGDREFWSGRLDGVGEAPAFTQPPVPEHAAEPIRHSGYLTAAQWRRVRAGADRFDVSWPALLAATTALLLHADTGARTVVLGLSVPAKRSWHAFGMTSNVVPLRLDIDPAGTVGDLARAAQTESRIILRHQHYRWFDMLTHGLVPDNLGWAAGPMLNILPMARELAFGPVRGTLHHISAGAPADFGIGVYDNGDGPLRIDFDTASDRWPAADLAIRHDHFLATLTAVADAADDQVLAGIRSGREADGAIGRGPVIEIGDRPVAAVFEAVAREHPDRPALWAAGGEHTYRGLNARANRLAHHWAREHDVRLGTPIGIGLPRSPELIVAFLAILKLGALCVPVHDDDPGERVEQLMRHTGTRILLRAHADIVAAERAARSCPETDPGRVIPMDLPAWLMFTSGSTGMPKGVEITHRALVERALDSIGSGPEHARLLFHSPYNWDIAAYELWMPLLTGRTVVIAPPGRLSAGDFRDVLAAGEVTAVFLTAGLLQVLAEEIPDSLGRLRVLSSAGDVVPPDAVRAVHAAGPEVQMLNHYGPVEATAFATAQVIADAGDGDEPLPIGTAVDNTIVLVLDTMLRPVPRGAVGEIYLAGAGLAQGYHRLPGLTAQRFVADVSGAPGARMYRTGDYGRWDERGALRFLGRGDRQVKINGIRVEPSEVEAALRRAPGVTAAVVTVHRGRAGKSLHAYVVADTEIDPVRFRAELALSLPGYLVPTAIVQIPELPITARGKVDRNALPAPADTAGAQPARTPRQQILAGLFAAAIGVDRVGMHDDFFRLGGNSLSAIRLVGSVTETMNTVVTLRDVFEAPTVADLERRLLDRHGDPVAARPRLGELPRPAAIPLSPAQLRLWTVNYLSEGRADYLLPAALDLHGDIDPDAVRAAVDDVVRRHEALRTVLPYTAAGPVQRIAEFAPGATDFEVVEIGPEAADAAVAAETRRGFRLMTEPPLRVRLYRLAPDRHLLLVVLHHSAGDGEAMVTLFRDIEFAYRARALGSEPEWAAPAVQLADYTVWLESVTGNEADPAGTAHRAATYWNTELADLPAEAALPTDRPRTERTDSSVGSVALALSPHTHARVLDTARRCGASTYTLLHAALVCALQRLGAGQDLLVGTALSGRDTEELDSVLGCLVHTVLIRTRTAETRTYRDLVRQIRDRLLDAHEHKEYPFDRLAERLRPAGAAANHPLPQIMTTYSRDIEPAGDDAGLGVRLRTLAQHRIEFELLLDLREMVTGAGAPGGIRGDLRYAAELWSPETMNTLATAMTEALEAMCGDIDAAVLPAEQVAAG
ncbi:amino acid adenylation domain-containing protein [Nocardia sp. NPDC005978]|uniref:amino acid adenylation domain-containing protein n=1 Tax=Nocardia sp. NPDC005978 TaxID=3156725 RepID=UPI0033AEC957